MALALSLMDDLRAQWNSALYQYAQAVADLDRAESQLYEYQWIANQDADDWAEWQAQFSRVNAIKSTVQRLETIAQNVSAFWSQARSTFGLSGRKGMAGHLGIAPVAGAVIAGMTLSGFLLLIGKVAIVAAGVGAFIMYLLAKNDASANMQQTYEALVADGVDPERAAVIARDNATAAAKASSGYTFTTEITKMVAYSALAIAAVFVLPKLIGSGR